jgi:hypothetical protein
MTKAELDAGKTTESVYEHRSRNITFVPCVVWQLQQAVIVATTVGSELRRCIVAWHDYR